MHKFQLQLFKNSRTIVAPHVSVAHESLLETLYYAMIATPPGMKSVENRLNVKDDTRHQQKLEHMCGRKNHLLIKIGMNKKDVKAK